MVLKMWSCSAAWVPLVLVVLFAVANTEAACADQKADCKENETTVIEKVRAESSCMLSIFLKEVCTTFKMLSKCLKDAGCQDFKNKTTKVGPTMCTLVQFEVSCKPPIDLSGTDLKCNETHKSNSSMCLTEAQRAFETLQKGTVCTKTNVNSTLCRTYLNMSRCLAVKRLPCKPLESNTALVNGTQCTLKVFNDDACIRPGVTTAKPGLTTTKSGNKKAKPGVTSTKAPTRKKPVAGHLSPFRTAGFSLVLFLCETAVMLLVLQ